MLGKNKPAQLNLTLTCTFVKIHISLNIQFNNSFWKKYQNLKICGSIPGRTIKVS